MFVNFSRWPFPDALEGIATGGFGVCRIVRPVPLLDGIVQFALENRRQQRVSVHGTPAASRKPRWLMIPNPAN